MRRLPGLPSKLKVTIIYGEDSWISPKLTDTDLETEGCSTNISIVTIQEATHHVYADQFEKFNEILIKLVENDSQR